MVKSQLMVLIVIIYGGGRAKFSQDYNYLFYIFLYVSYIFNIFTLGLYYYRNLKRYTTTTFKCLKGIDVLISLKNLPIKIASEA